MNRAASNGKKSVLAVAFTLIFLVVMALVLTGYFLQPNSVATIKQNPKQPSSAASSADTNRTSILELTSFYLNHTSAPLVATPVSSVAPKPAVPPILPKYFIQFPIAQIWVKRRGQTPPLQRVPQTPIKQEAETR
jgi:hypothetical protein